jgi:hypothetical protein
MNEGAKKCEGCGAEITPEQIVQRQAGLVKGVLLCPQCVDAKRQEAMRAAAAGNANANVGGNASTASATVAAATLPRKDLTEEHISLVDAKNVPGGGSGLIRSFASGSSLGGVHHDSHLTRPLTGPTEPPTRCRTFHGKLTPAALAHMDEQINEWIDHHPDIYIKHVTSTVGPFEAKHVEQHLIVTVYY